MSPNSVKTISPYRLRGSKVAIHQKRSGRQAKKAVNGVTKRAPPKVNNPPATNAKVQECGRVFTRQVDQLPPKAVLDEIDAKVDMHKLEAKLMEEGIEKFASPQKALLALIAEKRTALQQPATR